VVTSWESTFATALIISARPSAGKNALILQYSSRVDRRSNLKQDILRSPAYYIARGRRPYLIVLDKASKNHKWLTRDISAGLVGLCAAAVFVLATLWMQEYTSTTFLTVSLFLFPVPVACGLAVGLVSPQGAIFWAPVWASISTLLLFALMSGGIQDAGIVLSPWRMLYVIAGAVLAGVAGVIGRHASRTGHSWRAVLTFVVLCGIMAGVEREVVRLQLARFERYLVPQIMAQLDRDYLRLPRDLSWTSRWKPSLDSYEVSTEIRGAKLRVLCAAQAPQIHAVSYVFPQNHTRLSSDQAAKAYLRRIGVRGPLLAGLYKPKGADQWRSGLGGTLLVLSPDGALKLKPLPQYESWLQN